MINFIEQSRMDSFFIELTDIFVYSLETGLANIAEFPIKIKNEHTLFALKLGLDCIENGLDSSLIETILETSTLIALKDNVISKQELFELKLLEKIVPYIQSSEVQKFLILSGQLCSINLRNILENKLKRCLY